ncbi:hypothetical protein C8R44DRAFT_727940 [Mycena epipterygia]|nr:hypothetical protein C8R44DRAFT_727940 [Mycena epipterygia]
MNVLRVNTTAWNLDDLETQLKSFYQLHLPRYTSHSSIIVNVPDYACVLLVAAVIFSFSKLANRPCKPSDSLQALSTVIAPTFVAWPREYVRLVDHFTLPRSKTLAISMTSLIDSVCDGAVEFRNYADLPELFSEKLVVYGWRVTLTLDTLWNLEVLRWVVGSHFSWRQEGSSSKHTDRWAAHGASEPPATSLSCSITSNPHLDLDYIPFSHLEPSLLRLRAALAPGTVATLEFTTPAPSTTFLSTPFNLCAVPFLPRKYAVGAPRRTRTATPLLASVHRVLELLAAGPGPAALTLERVENVSKTYAEGLNAAAGHLEDDRATRAAFIQQWGVAGWREQRLMMAWEAALFSAGHLTRWVVVVRK